MPIGVRLVRLRRERVHARGVLAPRLEGASRGSRSIEKQQTPDGVVHKDTGHPKTYYASLVHDALYQFIPDGLPLGRRHADRFFLLLMAESDFSPRWVYWVAVRVFGGLFRRVMRVKRKTNGSVQPVNDLVAAAPRPILGPSRTRA